MSKLIAHRQAELMVNAGQFLRAVQAVHEHHQIESWTDEGSPFDDRVLSGLLLGLELVGKRLLDEGCAYLDAEEAGA